MIELAKHIEVLLLENDCVIVPGLGGFIAHNRPAEFKKSANVFCPPVRTIGFNPQLVMNDGLLVQSYMQAYNTDFPDATRKIEKIVSDIKEQLYRNGQAEIENVGTLYYTMNGVYGFEPFANTFFNPHLYGLGSFTMSPLHELSESKPAVALSDSVINGSLRSGNSLLNSEISITQNPEISIVQSPDVERIFAANSEAKPADDAARIGMEMVYRNSENDSVDNNGVGNDSIGNNGIAKHDNDNVVSADSNNTEKRIVLIELSGNNQARFDSAECDRSACNTENCINVGDKQVSDTESLIDNVAAVQNEAKTIGNRIVSAESVSTKNLSANDNTTSDTDVTLHNSHNNDVSSHRNDKLKKIFRKMTEHIVGTAAAVILFFVLSTPVENTYLDNASYASLGAETMLDAIRDRSWVTSHKDASTGNEDDFYQNRNIVRTKNNVNTLKPVAVKSVKVEKTENEEKNNKAKDNVKAEKAGNNGKAEKAEKAENVEKAEKAEKSDKAAKSAVKKDETTGDSKNSMAGNPDSKQNKQNNLNNQANQVNQVNQVKSNMSHVIVASLPSKADAEKELGKFKAEGYSDAKILESDGRFRISLYSFANSADAYKKTSELRKIEKFKGAWVFKSK